MEIADIFVGAFTRVRRGRGCRLEGLDRAELAWRADAEANSIAWLVWHLTRVQDDHIERRGGPRTGVGGQGWYDRFGLPFDKRPHGYGHGPDDVAKVEAVGGLLRGYHEAVFDRTSPSSRACTPRTWTGWSTRRWDPPVTLGVRLVSVAEDEFQHLGQVGSSAASIVRRR